MKLASFETGGAASYGYVDGDEIVDLGKFFGARAPDLRSAIAAGVLKDAKAQAAGAPRHRLDAVKMLPVIPNPDKVLCIGINYRTHIAETGREFPVHPMIFVRFANSQIGDGQPMIKPLESDNYDFEGELAVIIGKTGRRISKEKAFDYVAGYSCYNDGSVRDWQRHTIQFTPGKNFPASGAFGPWMVTTDEIPDPAALDLETRLNGQMVQKATISDLVFDVPALLAYCSSFTVLEPGDVIITGTTGGVGAFRKPPLWMKDGDTVEVEISKIGILRNPVIAEKA